MVDITEDDVLEFISEMKVLELSKFIKKVEDRFGVSAAAPVAFAPGAMNGGGSAEAVEEKTEFDVILESIGDKKINVIKEVRSITQLGLKEAKALVEEAPKAVKEGISKSEAEKIQKQLEGAGAQVSLK